MSQKKIKLQEVPWKKIGKDLLKTRSTQDLFKELSQIKTQFESIDVSGSLTPSMREKLKHLEKKYKMILPQISQAQKKFDRDLNRILRKLKNTKEEARKLKIALAKKMLEEEKAQKKIQRKTQKKKTSSKKKSSLKSVK